MSVKRVSVQWPIIVYVTQIKWKTRILKANVSFLVSERRLKFHLWMELKRSKAVNSSDFQKSEEWPRYRRLNASIAFYLWNQMNFQAIVLCIWNLLFSFHRLSMSTHTYVSHLNESHSLKFNRKFSFVTCTKIKCVLSKHMLTIARWLHKGRNFVEIITSKYSLHWSCEHGRMHA